MADNDESSIKVNQQEEEEQPLISPETPNDEIADIVEEEGDKKSPRMQIMREFFGMAMQTGLPGLAQKMTPANIDKAIDASDKRNQREYRIIRNRQIISVVIVVIGVVVLFGLIAVFKDDRETLKQILVAVVILLGGFAGGYGYGRTINT